jgi:hypothetical protein
VANFRLRLEFDNAQKRYQAGGTVSGRVVVDVEKDCEAYDLEVVLGWKTTGKGDRFVSDTDRQEIKLGEWKAGDNHAFPFELKLSHWPVSHIGNVVSVHHFVKAKVEAAWFSGDEVESSINVQAGPGTFGDARDRAEPHVGIANDRVGGLCLTSILLGISGVAVYTAVAEAGDGVGSMMVAFLFLVSALTVLFFSLRSTIAERRLGPVFVGLETTVQAGAGLQCLVRFRPTHAIAIGVIEASLWGTERAYKGSGKKRRTSTHETFKSTLKLSGPRTLKPGEVFEEQVTFKLPKDAAPSLDVSSNTIEWKLDLHVDLTGWPDWIHVYPIQVAPAFVEAGPELRITTRAGGSSVCPYCKDGFADWGPEAQITCAGCQTVFHKQCIREFGTCSTRGCRSTRLRA